MQAAELAGARVERGSACFPFRGCGLDPAPLMDLNKRRRLGDFHAPVCGGQRCSTMSARLASVLYRSSGHFRPCSVKCRPNPVAKRSLDPPRELLPGARNVQAGTLDLAEAWLGKHRFEVVPAAFLLQD